MSLVVRTLASLCALLGGIGMVVASFILFTNGEGAANTERYYELLLCLFGAFLCLCGGYGVVYGRFVKVH
jgi:hypothetical protein